MSRLLPVGRYSRNQRPLTGLKRGRVSAARLFRIAKFRERYEELMAPALEAAQVTVERVLREMTLGDGLLPRLAVNAVALDQHRAQERPPI